MNVVTLLRQLSSRERVGIALAFGMLDPTDRNPRARVVLDDGMVACLELNPPRVVFVLPADQVEWVRPE